MQHKNREQLLGYVNRFGSGLVIYWYGYVQSQEALDKDILVRDNFPATSIVCSSMVRLTFLIEFHRLVVVIIMSSFTIFSPFSLLFSFSLMA